MHKKAIEQAEQFTYVGGLINAETYKGELDLIDKHLD